MKELIQLRINHIKEVEKCLFFALDNLHTTPDVDDRIDLYESIKVLQPEYVKFIV